MRYTFEQVTSGLLTVAAVVIAGTLVYREFIRDPQPLPAGAPQGPQLIRDWRRIEGDGIRIGPPDAPVRLAVFSDFQCPFCKQFANTVSEARRRYPERVSYSFVHYPLPSHREARPAARAAECALRLGRFEPMHDLLYQKQESLGVKPWSSYAAESGIQAVSEFTACMSEPESPRIEGGIAAGRRIGVNGTPTIILNGWRVPGVSLDTLLQLASAARP